MTFGFLAELRAIVGAAAAPKLMLAAVGPGEVMIVAIVFGTGAMLIYPLIRSWTGGGHDGEGKRPLAPRDIEARLDRMERGIEAIAEEVERISENQRFVTQLMSKDESHLRLPPTETR